MSQETTNRAEAVDMIAKLYGENKEMTKLLFESLRFLAYAHQVASQMDAPNATTKIKDLMSRIERRLGA